MKLTFQVLAALVVLLQFSHAFTFWPSAKVYSEAEINKTTVSQNQVPSSSGKIIFPTNPPATLQTTTKISTKFTTTSTPSPATTKNSTEQVKASLNSTVLENLQNREATFSNQTNTTSAGVNCKPESPPKTSYLTDETIRSKLCSDIPTANLSWEYRFDLDAKVCSPTGKQAHCGKNMKFYSFSGNKVYGHCDCDYSSNTPLIYHEETSRCYFMYQQGFCNITQWVELSRENYTTTCTKNHCYDSGRTRFGAPPLASRDIEPEYVPLNGVGPCVKLNQPNTRYCKGNNNVVAFRWPLQFYPNCGEPQPTPPPPTNTSFVLVPRYLGEVATLECNPGSYLAAGTCQPEWEFD